MWPGQRSETSQTQEPGRAQAQHFPSMQEPLGLTTALQGNQTHRNQNKKQLRLTSSPDPSVVAHDKSEVTLLSSVCVPGSLDVEAHPCNSSTQKAEAGVGA